MMEDRIVGKHVYGSMYDVVERAYEDEEWLRKLVEEAARVANAKLIESRSWKLPGHKGGISVLVLVEESHLAVHTWREYRYATVDIYTCGDHTDPWKAWSFLLEHLRPRKYTVHYADRSQL